MTIPIKIKVGKRGFSEDSLDSATLVQTVTGFPVPRTGEFVFGRREDTGAQYSARVVWVNHDYEEKAIIVFGQLT